MAARQRYPAVHEQLVVLAREARVLGVGFDEWWAAAVRPGLPAVTWRTPPERRPYGCVVWPNDTFDRKCAMDATLDGVTRDGWRRAYEGCAPTRQDTALRLLAPVLEAADRALVLA